MFFGDFYPRMDDKGRLALPAKFRDALGAGMVITKAQDGCLSVYPRAQFERIAERLDSAGMTNPAIRNYTRQLFGGADDQIPDKQGRIVLKPALRQFAGLNRDCVVLGVNTHVEIWDAEAHRSHSEAQEQNFVGPNSDLPPI